MKVAAVILAGGNGIRFDSDVPKQYLSFNNGPSALERSVQVFLSHKSVQKVQVVIGVEHKAFYKLEDQEKLFPVIFGGSRRQDSALNALEILENEKPDFILIHDAARPFVSHNLINKVLDKLKTNNAVIPVLNITDSIIRINDDSTVKQNITNNQLFSVQTPQGFRFIDILHCHKLEKGSSEIFTDDASLLHKYGLPVATVKGDNRNIKITHKECISENA